MAIYGNVLFAADKILLCIKSNDTIRYDRRV